jgi:hypothetical protein
LVGQSRGRLLARARTLRPSPRRRFLSGVPRLAFAALGALVVLLFGGRGLLVASAAALPGDPLYVVKRTAEDLRLRFSSTSARVELEQEYNDRRALEIHELFSLGRVSAVTFEGLVTAMSEDSWTVGDLSVLLSPETVIEGMATPGRSVEVSGETESSGAIRAHRIRLRAFEFTGTVESIEGREWVVGGARLEVPRGTPIDDGIRLGARALVSVRVDDEGQWIARRISLIGPLPPPPTATPRPSSTPEPLFTEDNEQQEEEGEEIELDGALESIGGSSWVVAGRQVLIGSDTEIEGHPDVGDRLRVWGVLQAGGVILAERIRIEEEDETQEAEETEAAPPSTTRTPDDDEDQESERVEFTGDVESISAGIWLIGGQTVIVTPETEIDGDPEVGDSVRVRAVRLANGDLVAERIERGD